MISSTSLPEPGLIRAACGEADIQTLNELISRIVENKSLSNEKLYELLLDADENKSTSLHAACHAILFKPMRNAPKDAKVDLYGQVNQESNGAVQCIELLLRNHVPVNIRNNVGITPVYISARDAQVKAIELLAKANADPNIPALNGISPLMYAASHDQKVATSTLLSLFSGTIQVNAVDSANRTALAMACRGYPECVKLLLDVGADPNIGDNTAVTPLMVACGYGCDASVRHLLEHHANVALKDKRGRDALVYCTMSGSTACENLIQAQCSV